MKKKTLIGAALACAMTACIALAGCSGGNAESGSTELNIVCNTSNTTTSFTLDPAVQYQGGSSVTLGVCETLFELTEDETDANGILATGYEMSSDGLTWTISIRDNVKFSNGRDLDAQAVKESLEYELAGVERLASMLSIANMEANGQTLTITTSTPVPTLPKILSDTNLLVFDTHESGDLSKNIIGTGAYVLQSVDSDGNCEMVRNDNYWRGKPIAEKVHSKCGLDTTAIASALQSGEIDWGSVAATDASLFKNNAEYQEYSSTSNGRVYYLYLNPSYTFTQDPAICEALTYAIDRDSIVNGLYAGAGEPAYSIFPSYSPYYSDANDQPHYNADKAKEILAKAGYTDTDGDGFVEKDGQKVTLNITCYSANQFPKLSEALQAMFKSIGIDSEIKVSDAIMDDLKAGQFNIATYGYNTLTYGDALNYLAPVFKTGGNSNFTNYSNPTVDEALTQMAAESNMDNRVALAQKVQAEVLSSNQYIYIMRPITYTYVNSNVTTSETVFGVNKTVGQYLWAIDKTN